MSATLVPINVGTKAVWQVTWYGAGDPVQIEQRTVGQSLSLRAGTGRLLVRADGAVVIDVAVELKDGMTYRADFAGGSVNTAPMPPKGAKAVKGRRGILVPVLVGLGLLAAAAFAWSRKR